MSGILPYLEKRLVDAGITTAIELGRVPDAPDAVIALVERPSGPSKDLDANSRPALEVLRVHLTARAGKDEGSRAAEAIALDAYRALLGRHLSITPTGLPARRIDWIRAAHVPSAVGFDANDRPLATTALLIQAHGSLAAYTPPD